MQRIPIQTVSFSNDRDPAGPEHHWVARKQVKRIRLYFAELFLQTRSSGHSGQIEMPSL